MIEAHELETFDTVRHGFFTRRGGVSKDIYTSLNCGIGSSDERIHIQTNRARVAESLGVGARQLATPYQVHGITVTEAASPWDWLDPPRADAVVTKVAQLAIGISTADCAPVLFADPLCGVIGAAHAGWRGALAGVCEATIGAMEQLGASRASITAVVGPCISSANYQVGPEFHGAFVDDDPDNARYFRADPGNAKFYFDLPGYTAERLTRAGIATVGCVGRCTYGEENEFYSYRRATHSRDRDYGRQLSAIVLA